MDNSKTAPDNKATSQKRELYKDSDFLGYTTYTQQHNTGWYNRDAENVDGQEDNLHRMPTSLQIQPVYKQGIQSTWILIADNPGDSYRVFTGLRPTTVQEWYYGDMPAFDGDKITKRLLLVEFSPDRYQFRLHVFNGYPARPKRLKKISVIVHTILQERSQFPATKH
jgi:hypothetical protein